jgi:hypothetical protein
MTTPPTTIDGMEETYKDYATLSALWNAHKRPKEFKAELAHRDLTEILDVADNADWERLRHAVLKIRVPDSESFDGLEAYVPLQFSVEIDDNPELAQSYLFRHKIVYAWTFTLAPKTHWWERLPWVRQPQPTTRKAVSRGPSVVQYFLRPGQAGVQLELRYKNDPIQIPRCDAIAIQKSSDYGLLSYFERAEMTGWAIAAVMAMVTGLSIFWAKGLVFGSFQDYLSLFIWGVGIDQTKNFIQNVQAYSPTPAAKTP